jgi:hypothetical protein
LGTNQYVGTVARFADDLHALRVVRPLRDEAIRLYMSAPFDRPNESWRLFYLHVYSALDRVPSRSYDAAAARRVYALLDDDFGRRLFDDCDRARLRRTLFEDRVA